MFFILSKLLFFLIVPFNWLLLLVAAFLLVKQQRTKKRLLITMAVIFILFTNGALYHVANYHWQINEPAIETGKQYEAGIVLGGMTTFDRNGKGYLNQTGDRFTQTLKLYNLGIIKRILVTGGSGLLSQQQPSEADFIKQQLIANKVAADDILTEGRSKSTFENAAFSKKLCDSLKLTPPYVLISSATHLRRAIKVFDKAGMPVLAYPASFEVIDNGLSWSDYIFPDISVLSKWTTIIKEMVGLAVYNITGRA